MTVSSCSVLVNRVIMNVVLLKLRPYYLLVFISFVGCTLITADFDGDATSVEPEPEPEPDPDPDCDPDPTEDSNSQFIPFQPGIESGNNICPSGDVDVYAFTITETTPQEVGIRLSFNLANDLDLALFQGRSTYPLGDPLIRSNGSNTEIINIAVDASVENEFLIEVRGSTAPNAPEIIVSDYDLNLTVAPVVVP